MYIRTRDTLRVIRNPKFNQSGQALFADFTAVSEACLPETAYSSFFDLYVRVKWIRSELLGGVEKPEKLVELGSEKKGVKIVI